MNHPPRQDSRISPRPVAARPGGRRFPTVFLLVLALLAPGWLQRLSAQAAVTTDNGTATRILPDSFQDQVGFRVLIEVVPPTATAVQSIEERVPAGWTVTDINYGGTLDPLRHSVKWGPFTDDLRRTLAYSLKAPLDAAPAVDLEGSSDFGTGPRRIEGPSHLPKQPGFARRHLPATYLPHQPVEVHLEVQPGDSTLAWALQESLPPGWEPVDLPSDVTYDARTHALKWGPFLNPDPRDLRYRVRPGTTSRTNAFFRGIALFEAISGSIQGDQTLPIQPSGLTRTLPPRFTPNTPALVGLHSQPAPYVEVFSVEEDIPDGLNVGTISHGGVWDAARRRIKWGPFTDSQSRHFEYEVTPPSRSPAYYEFAGRGQFDSDSLTTAGPSRWESARATGPGTLAADFPMLFLPGQELRIRLLAAPSPSIRIHAYEVPVPPGWTFVRATEGGVLDVTQRRVKWGPFSDPNPRTLEADLIPDIASRMAVTLHAVGWLDRFEVPAQGILTISPTPSRTLRVLPARFTPGTRYLVQLELLPAPGLAFATLEDSLPEGATAGDISDGGVWDPIQSKVKWGPFPGPTRRTLTYRVLPPLDARGTAHFSGTAVFDTQSAAIEGDTQVLLNHDPLPQPDVLQRPPARTSKISLVELLANDSDTDGDPLRVVQVNPVSARGASLQLLGPWLYYVSKTDPGSEDQFGYTVEDAFGSRSVSSATILFARQTVTSRLSVLSATPEPSGTTKVRFVAVPGSVCQVEVSPDLRSWTFLAEVATDAFGVGELLDSSTSTSPVRFYRIAIR